MPKCSLAKKSDPAGRSNGNPLRSEQVSTERGGARLEPKPSGWKTPNKWKLIAGKNESIFMGDSRG